MSLLFLTEHDVRAALPPSEFPALVDLMEATLRDLSAGAATQPVRTAVPVGPPGQYLGVMPALLGGARALGTKLVSVVPANASRGLSTHLGVVALFDPETGAPTAILDARYITEVRTAAVSAVSVRRMAQPGPARLALIGSGIQARSHVEILARVTALEEVRAWSPDRPQLLDFCREMSSHAGVEVSPADSAESAVRDANLVVLVTSAAQPVVYDAWIGPGTHIVSVGACRPHQREMDGALVRRSRLIVDSRAAALVEAGDIVQAMAEGLIQPSHIAGELGEVAAGLVAGRTGPGELTLFKSLGQAVEDVATAALVLKRATAAGIGTTLSL
jgi:alanine dehydrogenase